MRKFIIGAGLCIGLLLLSGGSRYIAPGGDGAATKEFSIYGVSSVAESTLVGSNWRNYNLGVSGEIFFQFIVTSDFSGVVEAVIGIIPDTEETIQHDIDTSVSAIGEAFDVDDRQTLNVETVIGAGDVDTLFEIDISGELAGLNPGDVVSIRFQSDTPSIRTAYFRFKWN